MFQSNVVLQGAHGAETHNMDGEKLYEMLMILLKVFENALALSSSLGLEGARKIYFKVTFDVSADVGGICVPGHKGPWSIPAAR